MDNSLLGNARVAQIQDPHRPQYHFLPAKNWMNDPNGLIYWQGKYHIFYQYNPNGAFWGDMHWGHAVSSDLIHWRDLPIALAPTPNSPDESGCFSGCAVIHNGLPTFIYTGARDGHPTPQTQCVAVSHDNLLTWEKSAHNPVLAQVPSEANQTIDFRDPFVWKADNGMWYMVIASRIQDVAGAAFLYRSADLIEWEYLNPLLIGESSKTGRTWECPNFFQLGDKWVLVISGILSSESGTVFYFVGDFDNQRFTPIRQGVFDYGAMYAPLTFVGESDERLLVGWLRETRSINAQKDAGWSGVQSIPRRLWLDAQNRLNMEPVIQLDSIRKEALSLKAQALNDVEQVLNIEGLYLDIEAEFMLGEQAECGISVACSPDGIERTDIFYDAKKQRLIIRKSSREIAEHIVSQTHEIPHPLDADEPLQLRVLLDGSVVEIIANQRTSFTQRIYPKPYEQHLRLTGKDTQLKRLNIYDMPSIWQ